ncbi:MAG: hypothetical protein KC492_38765, partial [Myxococcales bacterium]|nr:hypothetical protein [Myxococcales bacterium]
TSPSVNGAPVNSATSANAEEKQSTSPPKTGEADAGAKPAAAADPFAGATFPPADFTPPFERSAQPGDGKWEAVAEGGEVDGKPIMFRTSLRPHLFKRFAFVNVVAIDLSRTEINLVAGTREPETKALPESERTGLVPAAVQPRLAAIFNGGFMTKHGGHGMGLGEIDLLPPRDELCTVALLDDGHVRVGTWSKISTEKARFRAWRQGPWCLLEESQVNPNVTSGKQRKYGMSAEGKMEIRRSAVGVSAGGGTLYYAVGEEQTPELMAKAMQVLGVPNATQLDINWSYTRFFWFGDKDGQMQVTETLLPKMKHRKTGYVSKAEPRDFFYVLRGRK